MKSNSSFQEAVKLVQESNIPDPSRTWTPQQDMFTQIPVKPPKPWFTKQFKLGFLWATAVYGTVAVSVIIYLKFIHPLI